MSLLVSSNLQIPQSRRAVRRIASLTILVVTVVALGGLGMLSYTAYSVDRVQAAEEQALVARRIRSPRWCATSPRPRCGMRPI
jgi:hypothetical protein